MMDWAISSQASYAEEGSTTRGAAPYPPSGGEVRGSGTPDKIWSGLHREVQRRMDRQGVNRYYPGMTFEDLTLSLIERFHQKWRQDPTTGCWLWQGATGGKGYGIIKRPGERRQHYAHRLSYVMHVGALADDAMVCHTCDNPRCVRPSHLFAGNAEANSQDMAEKDRHLHGSRNAQAKLTADRVRHMHNLHASGFSTGEIARRFGISQGQSWRILAGKRWVKVYREFHARADG